MTLARGEEHREAALVRPPRSGRGRRPSQQVRGAILGAADRLLRSEGMAGFTIEGVAALAGASKMTIYKWWPTKGVLALEAYAASVEVVLDVPDTGDVEDDLTAALTSFVGVLRETTGGRVTAELLGAAQTDPELAAAFRRVYLEPRRAVGTAVLLAARERGQVRAGTDPEALSDQLWGACVYRLLTGYLPMTEDYARTLVRTVLHGVGQPSVGTPSTTPTSRGRARSS